MNVPKSSQVEPACCYTRESFLGGRRKRWAFAFGWCKQPEEAAGKGREMEGRRYADESDGQRARVAAHLLP